MPIHLSCFFSFLLVCGAVADDEGQIGDWGKAIDPDGDCRLTAEAGALTILVPGPAHDLSVELDRMNAPRVLRPVSRDFEITVKVDGSFAPGRPTIPTRAAYQGAGLLIMQDESNYIRLERAVFKRSGRSFHYANFVVRADGRRVRMGLASDLPLASDKSTWLRVRRQGQAILGAVRQGDGPWRKLPSKLMTLPQQVEVGVVAINASDSPFSPRFSDLTLTAKPKQNAEQTNGQRRWAILPTKATLAGLSDLLAAELSTSLGIELVERDQIGRVLDELKLNASGLVDPSRVTRFGQLASADVLLLLEALDQPAGGQLRLSLVETRTGLRLLDLTLPRKSLEQELELIVHELRRAKSKTAIPDAQRQYVGVIPFRSEEPGNALKPVCETLTAMLESDLQHVPNVVVLERTQLQRLTGERDLTGIELELRTAARVIEAGVRRNGEGMQVSLRILSSGRNVIANVQVQEDTQDLGAVRACVSNEVRQALGIAWQQTAADLAAEAEMFGRRRQFFSRAYRYAETAQMAEAALALSPTPSNLSHALSAYRSWTHAKDGSLDSDEALPAARRLNELRLEWYRRMDSDGLRIRAFDNLTEPFEPHVRIPIEPESPEVRQIRAETDRLALQVYQLAYARAAENPEARLDLLFHRLEYAAYLAETGAQFAETMPVLIDETRRVLAQLEIPASFAVDKYVQFARLLKEQVGRGLANCDRSSITTDERQWNREELDPLLHALASHEDPAAKLAGQYGLISTPGETGLQAARFCLEAVVRWPPGTRRLDEFRGRVVTVATAKLRGTEEGKEFFASLLADAEKAGDPGNLLRLSGAVFFWVVRSDRKDKLARGERVLAVLDQGELDSEQARTASGLRRGITKHLRDLGLLKPPVFSIADAPGPWQDYVARRIRIQKHPDHLYPVAVAVDHHPEARERGGELVLVWMRRYRKFMVERVGLDGGTPRKIGEEFPGSPQAFRGVHVTVSPDAVYVASDTPGIAIVHPEGVEILDEEHGAPGNEVFHMGWLKDHLYVSLRDAFCRFDPRKKSFELLASATSLESRSPFDGGGSYFIYKVLPDTANDCLWLDVQDNAVPRSRYGIWRYEPRSGKFHHMHHKAHHRAVIIPENDGGPLFYAGGDHPWTRFDSQSGQLVGVPGYARGQKPPDQAATLSQYIRVGEHLVSGYGQLFTPDGKRYDAPTDASWRFLQRVGPGFITHFEPKSDVVLWYISPKQDTERDSQ